MTIVLPAEKRRTFLQGLAGGLAQTGPSTLMSYFDEQKQKKLDEQEAEVLEKFGVPKTVKSKEARRLLLDQYSENQKAAREEEKQEKSRQAAINAGVDPDLHPTLQAQQLRNKNPASAPGGLSGQPVPMETSQTIGKIIRSYPNASSDELALAFDEANIPRAYSNSYIENRRRSDESGARTTTEDRREQRREQLAFHKESEKYDEELLKQSKAAKKQKETIKDISKAVNSGKIKPSSIASIFKGFGKIGDKISDALLTGDEATLSSSIPQLLEGWKEVFGVRLSDADLKILQDKLPSISKNPEANRAILKILDKYSEMTLLRDSIAKDIKKKNGDLRPLGYADLIEERFDEMTTPITIINPNTGKPIQIPAYKLSDALQAGATLANE